jgi:hypothetical protein
MAEGQKGRREEGQKSRRAEGLFCRNIRYSEAVFLVVGDPPMNEL